MYNLFKKNRYRFPHLSIQLAPSSHNQVPAVSADSKHAELWVEVGQHTVEDAELVLVQPLVVPAVP